MPTAIAARNYSNVAPVTNLTANIDNALTTTNIPVSTTAGYPPVPFTGCFERNTGNQEFCLTTAVVDANHFTVVRGYDGTPPVAHLATATFEHCSGAIDFREANQHHTDNTRDDHPQYANLSGVRPFTGLQGHSAGLSSTFLASTGTPGAPNASRYMGTTTSGPPTGTGVSYLIGDWVHDLTGAKYFCVLAGAPGQWVAEPGRVMGNVKGPGTGLDIINVNHTLITYTFTALKNIQYIANVSIQGTVVTAIPNYINCVVTGSAGTLTGSILVMSYPSTALAVNAGMGGSLTLGLNVLGATASTTITVTSTSSGTGRAYRLAAGAAQLLIWRA